MYCTINYRHTIVTYKKTRKLATNKFRNNHRLIGACKYSAYMTLPYGLNFCDKELGLAFLRIETSRSVDKKLVCTIYNMSDSVIPAYIMQTWMRMLPTLFPGHFPRLAVEEIAVGLAGAFLILTGCLSILIYYQIIANL